MAVATPERETVRAQARYVRCSARKARLVLEHIRGKQAAEAKAILAFATRAAAKDAGKVLASAIANAENNNGYDVDDLVVVAAYADEGPTLKRWRPRARGRVNRIRKRTCHITIQLAVAEPGEIKRPKPRRVAEPVAETAPAEKPKRRPRAKKAAPEAAPETAAPETAAPETAAPVAETEAVAESEPAQEPQAATEEAPDAPEEGGE
jgi:large subunit ribosomal protein L22